jgi:hypothetical protein
MWDLLLSEFYVWQTTSDVAIIFSFYWWTWYKFNHFHKPQLLKYSQRVPHSQRFLSLGALLGVTLTFLCSIHYVVFTTLSSLILLLWLQFFSLTFTALISVYPIFSCIFTCKATMLPTLFVDYIIQFIW